jgi:O-antigen ligase
LGNQSRMNYIDLNKKIAIYLAGIIAFLIPISPTLLSLAVALFVLNWIISPEKSIRLIQYKGQLPFLFSILFYISYGIGMCYTTNVNEGLSSLETKFSFFILPIVFLKYKTELTDKLVLYLRIFILSCTINALICFGFAAFRFFKPELVVLYGIPYDLGAGYFYYNELSHFFHPSYIAMYCVFALFALVHINQTKLLPNTFNSPKWLNGVVGFILTFFVLLLSSKAGWIGLFGFFTYLFVLLIKNKQTLKGIILMLCLAGGFYFFNINYTPKFSARIPKLSVIKDALNNDGTKPTNSSDGNGSRVLVWKAAIDLFKQHPVIGVGTGDAKDKMLEMYKQKGMQSEYESQLNSHNQYLNTAVALGLIGVSILLLCFASSFYFAFKDKNFLLLVFVSLAGMNFLFESMLERQAGVIFFVFFYTLLNYRLPQSAVESTH